MTSPEAVKKGKPAENSKTQSPSDKKPTPKKVITTKEHVQSIQDSVERMAKARKERERVQFMKDKGLMNTKAPDTPSKAKKAEIPKSDKKSPAVKVQTPKKEETPLLAMNLKFGEKTEAVRYFKGDNLAEIVRNIAQRNSMIDATIR